MITTPSPAMTKAHSVPKRFEGTYKNVSAVEWLTLLGCNFHNPDWEALYPINAKGAPVGLFSPRMACKFFFDALFILQKTDENPKYLQDRLPECIHRSYKKKQWRKQFMEAARRVTCRIAKGMGFKPNCPAEDCFIHIILRDTFELGWRRVSHITENLPETDKDRDYNRVIRLGASEEIGFLYKVDSESKSEKRKDFKSWFKAYNADAAQLSDHLVAM